MKCFGIFLAILCGTVAAMALFGMWLAGWEWLFAEVLGFAEPLAAPLTAFFAVILPVVSVVSWLVCHDSEWSA